MDAISQPVLSEPGKSIRQLKEDFVTGLAGSDLYDICSTTLVAVSCYFLWCALQSRLDFFKDKWGVLPQTVDFMLNWLGCLFSLTLYANNVVLFNVLLILPGIILLLWPKAPKKTERSVKHTSAKNSALDSEKSVKEAHGAISSADIRHRLPRKNFLTTYRGAMMVITCVAILSVDFKVFPRRFAKVETWGTSIMDLGVGSFVFSMGLVSSRAKLLDTYNSIKTPFFTALLKSFAKAFPIIALGAIRLLLVKFLDYQEHVTEYGIHWNFFITLGSLPPMVTILGFLPAKLPVAFIALITSIIYELALNFTGLSAFILTAPRTNLLSMNKEGIFSFIGYLAIFLAGQSTGFYVLPDTVDWTNYFQPSVNDVKPASEKSPSSGSRSSRYHVVIMLVSTSAFYWTLFYISQILDLTVSRRLANLPYMLWVVAYNTLYLSLFVIVEMLFFPENATSSVPLSFEACNTNGLAVFLLANISTGVVNMAVNTLECSRNQSMLLLSGYCLFLCGVSNWLKYSNKRLKI